MLSHVRVHELPLSFCDLGGMCRLFGIELDTGRQQSTLEM